MRSASQGRATAEQCNPERGRYEATNAHAHVLHVAGIDS
jgi:hypothetical protein